MLMRDKGNLGRFDMNWLRRKGTLPGKNCGGKSSGWIGKVTPVAAQPLSPSAAASLALTRKS